MYICAVVNLLNPQAIKVDMTELKENIVKVMMEALRQSDKVGQKGIRYTYKELDLIKKTKVKILESELFHRKKYFESMPEDSEIFKSIHKSAKLALPNLQRRKYEINSQELINKFLSISEKFSTRRLKSIGTREVEEPVKKEYVPKIDEEKITIPEDSKKITYAKEGQSASKLKKELTELDTENLKEIDL